MDWLLYDNGPVMKELSHSSKPFNKTTDITTQWLYETIMCMTQLQLVTIVAIIQKQSLTDDLQNRCSQKFRKFHKESLLL